jgi:rubrerythrin
MKVKVAGEEIQIFDFNPVEALKIARKLEREGINFYGDLLKKAEDPKVKEALNYLRGQEEDHLKIFEKLLEREDPETVDDDEDDVFDCVDDGVFLLPQEKDLAADFDSALELGVTIEKRSLAFYLELVKYTESEDGKKTINKIIEEEKKHWVELKKFIQ